MNRRAFLKSIAVGLTGLALDTRIDQILTETASLKDADFITYVTITMNLWVTNPAHSVVITNIADPTVTEILPLGHNCKYHYFCSNCNITLHLDYKLQFGFCLWCGSKSLQLKQNDIQGTISQV